MSIFFSSIDSLPVIEITIGGQRLTIFENMIVERRYIKVMLFIDVEFYSSLYVFPCLSLLTCF